MTGPGSSRPPLPERHPRPVRSYVVRTGRMTPAQRRGLEEDWPTYRLSLADGRVSWPAVFGRAAPVVLEIGFGMGDSLLAMAAADPGTDFVGIEVHPPGAGSLARAAAALRLTNLRIYLADALDVLDDCVPDASLTRVQIYFPDPWPKKKHHKRRLVQPALIERLRAKLMPGGLLHLATDWEPYAERMLEVLAADPGFRNLGDPFVARPDFRPPTRFERRGERLGHRVRDLLFRRTPQR
ncbi:MAG: tRNA (guanosine(46)-N7)-methyltransferase TrmB [Pseudomonadota bacterium]